MTDSESIYDGSFVERWFVFAGIGFGIISII